MVCKYGKVFIGDSGEKRKPESSLLYFGNISLCLKFNENEKFRKYVLIVEH